MHDRGTHTVRVSRSHLEYLAMLTGARLPAIIIGGVLGRPLCARLRISRNAARATRRPASTSARLRGFTALR